MYCLFSIRPALQRAFDSGRPAVLDVRIDQKECTVMDYAYVGAYNPKSWTREVKKKEETKEIEAQK